MGVTALVMAGGRGRRMKGVEKPLALLAGRPMMDYVLEALSATGEVDAIIVAASKHTPKTASRARSLGAKVILTPGLDYVSDMRYAAKRLRLRNFIAVPADLPLVTGRILCEAIDRFAHCQRPALAVMVPEELCRRLGLKPFFTLEVEGRRLCPSGVNAIRGEELDDSEIPQEVLILEYPELAFNINEPGDLTLASEFLKGKSRGSGAVFRAE